MNRRYFGTDGVRGRVGEPPLTPEFLMRLGWATGRVLAREPGARVLIGKDTRRSGYMFESALEAGFAAAGVEADLLGPLPTPGVAYLTRALRARAGVVISASHNRHYDNGVKLFSAEGDKLSDDIEAEIEALIDQPMQCVAPEHLGRARRIEDAQGRYIEFCKGTFGGSGSTLRGLRVVVDCAHGAAYKVAPAVFEELGAEVIAIGNRPDGFNINDECGSTALAALMAMVDERRADVGIALDGDGDRCLMVRSDGTTVDGDELLFVIARHAQDTGRLKGPVVGTVMSNFGLERALLNQGIGFERAAVGDRYVLEKLRKLGGIIGGETSGHTLCLDKASTGDGIVTALQVLEVMLTTEKPLAELVSGMEKVPQVLINVPVGGNARGIAGDPRIVEAEAAARTALGDRGRLLVRASGTEPVVRVMVEALDAEEAERVAKEVADQVSEVGCASTAPAPVTS